MNGKNDGFSPLVPHLQWQIRRQVDSSPSWKLKRLRSHIVARPRYEEAGGRSNKTPVDCGKIRGKLGVDEGFMIFMSG